MGKFFEIKEDCLCEHYLHELTRHYRPGLKEKKLSKGDVVKLDEIWSLLWNVCKSNL